ncbi:hypothetical protein [Kosmotoga pacifica]|nr:hypothetical protein [Kosmotoga pacifica]
MKEITNINHSHSDPKEIIKSEFFLEISLDVVSSRIMLEYFMLSCNAP